ncbi:nitrous oxide reductase accessory protein NosL [Robiginitalea sp. M366]|uniref:nitrous oxide reductase accessory protein NosL n=1 Tax=Robiginitalea aestuariiviva TaxID=3036903 RepID=UPI00240E46D5|nr:nitrous oxide reductase accessory protein NosL [Robiginitalea aestuariiviva]MDG1573325.1 nitrous oxide reductase accessory protein NosL [Robiginitalea aestuariiviva]
MKLQFLIPLTLLMLGCSVKPRPIRYGADACHFCRMTLVDRQHAAQMVTAKGRNYTFDAIECLADQLGQMPDTEMAYLLVADYAHPGELTQASEATYLVSPGIPSPMGAFLSAFAQEADARVAHEREGGTLYTWASLQTYLNTRQR